MGPATAFFILCIISGGMTSTLEVEGFCNVQVAEQSGSSCKCLTSSLLYDYSVNDCVDKNILYPVTECGPNADEQTCECKDGWARDSVTGLCIQEAEQCQDDSCGRERKCVELPGAVHCACLDTQYKASDTHCVPYNECSNPMWNDCAQICLDATVGYTCHCAKGFEGNGTHCEIQENYIDCSNETFVCSRFANGSVVVQFPRIGFLANGTDKDECNEPQSSTFCWPNSVCVNLDAGGGYECQCKPGYTDYNSTLRECLFIDQPHCSGCACEDVCADETCNERVLVCDSSVSCASDCVISLADTVLTLPVTTVAFYTGTLTVVVPQYNYHANNVHKALSAVLGRDVQVRSRSNAVFEFSVMTSSFRLANTKPDDIVQLLQAACLNINNSDSCALPSGVITAHDNIIVRVEDLCSNSSCPGPEYECTTLENGRLICKCKESGTGEYFMNFQETCANNVTCIETSTTTTTSSTTSRETTTITTSAFSSEPSPTQTSSPTTPDYEATAAELQKQLDKLQTSFTATAVTLGILLLISLVVVGVLFFKRNSVI